MVHCGQHSAHRVVTTCSWTSCSLIVFSCFMMITADIVPKVKCTLGQQCSLIVLPCTYSLSAMSESNSLTSQAVSMHSLKGSISHRQISETATRSLASRSGLYGLHCMLTQKQSGVVCNGVYLKVVSWLARAVMAAPQMLLACKANQLRLTGVP